MRLELLRDDRIDRQHDLAVAAFAAVQDCRARCRADPSRRATCRRLALRGEERVGHAAADDEEVDLLHEVARAGRAWSTPSRRRRSPRPGAAGLSSAPGQRLDLSLHRAARIGRQLMGEPLGRGMRAMRGGEGVVDVDVAELGEFGDEGRIVLLLALVEAGVLQQQRRRRASSPRRPSPAASPMQSAAKPTGRSRCSASACRDGAQRVLRHRARSSGGRNGRAGRPCRPCRRSRGSSAGCARCAWHRVTRPFSIGTLRSTRTSTRLPATSASSSVRNADMRAMLPFV